MSFKRAEKVSEAIKREVSVMLAREVKDPGIHFTTVTAVETADDLRNATIFVSVMGEEADRQETLAGLERAKGFLRSEIGRRLQLRYAPQIHFRIDKSLDHAFKIKGILDNLKEKDRKKQDDEG